MMSTLNGYGQFVGYVHEAQKAETVRERRTADTVIDVHNMLVGKSPALPDRVLSFVVDLAGDGSGLIGHAGLVG
jgi:hypothetical protein